MYCFFRVLFWVFSCVVESLERCMCLLNCFCKVVLIVLVLMVSKLCWVWVIVWVVSVRLVLLKCFSIGWVCFR